MAIEFRLRKKRKFYNLLLECEVSSLKIYDVKYSLTIDAKINLEKDVSY